MLQACENCDVRVSVCLALKRILQPPRSYPLLVLTTLNHYSLSFPSFSLSSFISLPLGSLEIPPSLPYQAVDDMNGKLVNNRPLYCGRAQKKKERVVELQRRYEAERMERYSR